MAFFRLVFRSRYIGVRPGIYHGIFHDNNLTGLSRSLFFWTYSPQVSQRIFRICIIRAMFVRPAHRTECTVSAPGKSVPVPALVRFFCFSVLPSFQSISPRFRPTSRIKSVCHCRTSRSQNGNCIAAPESVWLCFQKTRSIISMRISPFRSLLVCAIAFSTASKSAFSAHDSLSARFI